MGAASPLAVMIVRYKYGEQHKKRGTYGDMNDLVGQQLGNYRLTRLLGKGGFASVYLGEHCTLNMQAAIKVLHAQLINSDIDSFHDEARTISRLEHPHILRVLDFAVED